MVTSAVTKRTSRAGNRNQKWGGGEGTVNLKVGARVSLRRWYLNRDLKEVRRVRHMHMGGKRRRE